MHVFPQEQRASEPSLMGLTKREMFASAILAGIAASGPGKQWTNEDLARDAVQLADALIAELAK